MIRQIGDLAAAKVSLEDGIRAAHERLEQVHAQTLTAIRERDRLLRELAVLDAVIDTARQAASRRLLMVRILREDIKRMERARFGARP